MFIYKITFFYQKIKKTHLTYSLVDMILIFFEILLNLVFILDDKLEVKNTSIAALLISVNVVISFEIFT
jgi:hypothetical protein